MDRCCFLIMFFNIIYYTCTWILTPFSRKAQDDEKEGRKAAQDDKREGKEVAQDDGKAGGVDLANASSSANRVYFPLRHPRASR